MHTRKIVHGDLHLSNVLLNFNPDRTKRCLINDFGRARLHPGKQEFYDDVFQWAQAMVYLIACGKSMRDSQECRNRVRGMGRSAACLDILFFANNRRECPKRVSDLLKIDWFKGDAAAPLPTTARHVQRIASQIPKSKSMEEYLDTQKARSRDLIPSDVESERRRSSHELYAARRESPISPPMKHVRLPAWTRETVSHVIPEDEEVDLPRSSRAWGALRVPQASVTGPTRSEESFPRQRVMIKPPVSYPEPEPLMPAAEAAVAEGLQQHRENRGSLGARIRRSVSSLGQRVRSLNCFARHGH